MRTCDFKLYHSRTEVKGHRRTLDQMLLLPYDARQEFSFLCAGVGWMHGPLAIATVDPQVVRLDMHCAPPDRWHGVVDMIDDMTGVVRTHLKAQKQAQVCRCGLAVPSRMVRAG